MVQIV